MKERETKHIRIWRILNRQIEETQNITYVAVAREGDDESTLSGCGSFENHGYDFVQATAI